MVKRKQLMDDLTEILSKSFKDAEVKLEGSSPSKVAGFLIWKKFEGVEQIKRQEMLDKVLKEHLTKEQLLKITAILTVTPTEMTVVKEN